MSGLFEKTVAAICEEVARSQGQPSADVAAFVIGQWQRMPRFLAWPLRVATLVFACSGLPSGLFHRLPPAQRERKIESWRTSALGPCRDLMRFYRSLALLEVYRDACDSIGGTRR
ncbi:MAG: hypothetical protein JNL62_08005 [Bryobacterales bacterium]|nr:hypothetical protein [Bryobacterales bacterium]